MDELKSISSENTLSSAHIRSLRNAFDCSTIQFEERTHARDLWKSLNNIQVLEEEKNKLLYFLNELVGCHTIYADASMWDIRTESGHKFPEFIYSNKLNKILSEYREGNKNGK